MPSRHVGLALARPTGRVFACFCTILGLHPDCTLIAPCTLQPVDFSLVFRLFFCLFWERVLWRPRFWPVFCVFFCRLVFGLHPFAPYWFAQRVWRGFVLEWSAQRARGDSFFQWSPNGSGGVSFFNGSPNGSGGVSFFNGLPNGSGGVLFFNGLPNGSGGVLFLNGLPNGSGGVLFFNGSPNGPGGIRFSMVRPTALDTGSPNCARFLVFLSRAGCFDAR